MIERIVGALFVVAACQLLVSCDDSKDYCDALTERLRDPSVVSAIERWVDDRAGRWGQIRGPMYGGSRRLPGDYPVTESIDSLPLGFGSGAEARLVVGEEERVLSVYFGERSMQGIAVRVADSEYFGPIGRVHAEISPRIKVICQPRD